ncbi:MAG TPA: Flp pilus assembly protein CpaB [Actinomycetota bacterium]|nr:Flp pilus assembly protein CpaB [Actinomycetota bacterium]
MDVPSARRLARPRWLNPRTVLGLVLFAGALLVGRAVLDGAKTTVAVWAAAHDLRRDEALDAGDLVPAEVKLPADVAAAYAGAGEDLEGAVLTRPLVAGELIPRAWLATGPAAVAGRSMTIPVTPEHAVGGRLRPGDRVDVYATFDSGDVRARTSLLVREVEVLDVVSTGGLVVGEEAVVGVTVAVTPSEATRLAFAIRTAELDVALVSGAADGEGPTTVSAEDFR